MPLILLIKGDLPLPETHGGVATMFGVVVVELVVLAYSITTPARVMGWKRT